MQQDSENISNSKSCNKVYANTVINLQTTYASLVFLSIQFWQYK